MQRVSEGLVKKIKELMKNNRRYAGEFQYTVPSPYNYPYQWLWDSCFHAIILSHFSPEDGKRELRSLVSQQLEDGLIPHMIYWEKFDVLKIAWGREDTSTITQPPMLALAAWQVFSQDGDASFLQELYPALSSYYNYLLKERDPEGVGLVGIINPDESGEDNSPRFDIPLGNLSPKHSLEENEKRRLELVEKHLACDFRIRDCMKNFFWVRDVPFNAILVENLKHLAQIALALGRKQDATEFEKQAERIAKAMRSLMFEDGVFWSTYGDDYQKIKVKTWAIFAPLFAKLYTQEEAAMIVKEHLEDKKEFWLAYPVPTVARSEPSFDEQGFWRGPAWMATNWFVYKGLINYGLEETAQKVKEASVALVEKSGFREQFNPRTGKGQGAKEFTWGGLVIDM